MSSIFELIVVLIALFVLFFYIHDRYVQRRHQLLINYPIIGRMRYLFEILREPLRQYFANEQFYESRDKIDWVYKAAKNVPNFKSFSVSQPFAESRFILKHAHIVKNDGEVDTRFSVTFGANRSRPFVTRSVIGRSAMSDGALSPEATRAFTMAAFTAGFPLNTGEGGLTSNFFFTHRIDKNNADYLEIVTQKPLAEFAFKITDTLFNRAVALKLYRKMLLDKKTANTYIYDPNSHALFRPNWHAPLEAFPENVPHDMPDLVLQIGSGLYGVRQTDGTFSPDRYQKSMRFCRMTEVKIAQGAKQTGGKIVGAKVTPDIAYYRGVEAGKDLISPNRFPYANTAQELFDFIARLQELSQKPVGMKIVISGYDEIETLIEQIADRKQNGQSIVDFITVDSSEGGSATAPLELMESIGLTTANALFVLDALLRKYHLRDEIKIIISGKILTPDDVIIMMALGADFVNVARGFMMSAGCIRARVCSGTSGHTCPVGLATQDVRRRASYLVIKKASEIANYHDNLVKGMRTVLSVMGLSNVNKLEKKHLVYKNKLGEIFFNIEKYFNEKFHI